MTDSIILTNSERIACTMLVNHIVDTFGKDARTPSDAEEDVQIVAPIPRNKAQWKRETKGRAKS